MEVALPVISSYFSRIISYHKILKHKIKTVDLNFFLVSLLIFPRIFPGVSFPSCVNVSGGLVHFGLSDRCEEFVIAILKRKCKDGRAHKLSHLTWWWWWWWWWWMMNCFCCMVDRRRLYSLISSRDHCQRSSPSWISDTPRTGFETAQSLSSGLVEWSCAVVITTTSRCSMYIIDICKVFRNL